jgi:hypothetical protein
VTPSGKSLLCRQPYDELVTVPEPPAGPWPERRKLPSRKVVPLPVSGLTAPDSIEDWAGRYLDAAPTVGPAHQPGLPHTSCICFDLSPSYDVKVERKRASEPGVA